MKNKKNILILLPLISFLFFGFLGLVWVQAQPDAEITTWSEPFEHTNGAPNISNLSVQQIIANAINYFAGIVSLISVLVIIVAGIMWAISQGDEDKVKKARQWILAGVIGATIALAAWSITEVVIQGFLSGSSVSAIPAVPAIPI